MSKPIKLTRKQITEGLKQAPIEHILVGAHNIDKVNLTKKQKEFARKVAEGKPKAQAYREAYESQGKPATEGNEGHKLAKNPKIATMIEAFTLANEAREYLIPQQIRALAVEKLVGIAIDDNQKTSDKLRALELIGKMSEVALFTERKEIIHENKSEDIKAKLMEGLRQAFANSQKVNELAKRKAESLLVELSNGNNVPDEDNDSHYNSVTVWDGNEVTESETPTPSEISEPADPLSHDPLFSGFDESEGLHTIPHIQSPHYNNVTESGHIQSPRYNSVTPTNNTESSHYNSVTPQFTAESPHYNSVTVSHYNSVTPQSDSQSSHYNNVTVWEGALNSGQPAPEKSMENTPHTNSEQKG